MLITYLDFKHFKKVSNMIPTRFRRVFHKKQDVSQIMGLLRALRKNDFPIVCCASCIADGGSPTGNDLQE